MSKHETPMTLWYWSQVGGTLIEEFLAVRRGPERGERLLDGLIVHDGETRRVRGREFDIEEIRGRDVTIVQAKAKRLGMYLMGQALFSRSLLEPFGPRSVTSVALCAKDDVLLRPILEAHEGLKVVVYPAELLPG